MTNLEILSVALALGIDCMGVATAIGLKSPHRKIIVASILLFGFFQSLMAWIGMTTGEFLLGLARSRITLAPPFILIALGIAMIVKAVRSGNPKICVATYIAVVGASITVSIDALGVGIALGIAGKLSLFGIAVIGLTAAFLSTVGFATGLALRKIINVTEGTAGVILILIGVAMMIAR